MRKKFNLFFKISFVFLIYSLDLFIKQQQNTKTMTTLTNTTGSKEVKIRKNGENSFIAMYCQVYYGESQVLQSKSFANQKNAEKWANKVLN